MHQHDVRGEGLERFEAGAHGGLPGRAACDGRAQREAGGRFLKQPTVVHSDDRLDRVKSGSSEQSGYGLPQHGVAADLAELLGNAASGAQALPGGNDDGGDGAHCCFTHIGPV
jgi:hypothetical protein